MLFFCNIIVRFTFVLQCEEQLERKIHVLQAYAKWKELEPAFWQWMVN